MKKRVLSLLMALTLCFTMLPTAALAQQTGAADVYTTGEDTAVQGKRAAEAVRAAQALIDALPDEVTADNAEEIEAQLIALDEALAALTEEQLAALDMARYEALCAALAAQVSLTAERGGEHADHPVCGDASCKESSHQLPVGESWTAIHDAGELEGITKAGCYYLTGPVALTSTWYPEDGVVLCLNGQTITLNDGDRGDPASVIRVKGGVTFTLCDCQNTGTVTHGTNSDGDTYTGSGVWVDDDRYTTGPASFVLYGGSISGNTVAETMEDGAGVHLGYNAHFTMHGGTISGNSTTASDGGGVYMGDSNASFTMTGGEITDNSSGLSGGGVYAANGTFTMTGGTIGDNTVTGSGAGVYAAADCTLTMNGDARIAGNKATGNSARGGGVYVAGTCNMSGNAAITGNSAAYGGVYVNSGAAFTMNGGSITANTAKYGGGVWTATAFEVSGAPKIIDNTDSTDSTGSTKNNVYLSLGTTITIADALAPEARIGVTTGHENSIAPGKYVTVATGAEKGCTADNFSADKGGSCAIKAEGDNVNLYNGLPQEHPICGAAHKDINGHTGACADVTWTAWDGVSDITYDANNTAYVYLRDNAERDSALEIANGYTLYLCLSGHSLTKNKTGKSVIKVGDNATLSLCDCSDAQSGKLTHGTTSRGSKYEGHGVSLGYRSTFNMYGGSITGNRADTGGGVSLASEYSYAKFNMYGGSITNNAATNGDGGGGVHNLFGTFTMYGGSITGNSADTRCGGGGVYLARMGEFVMKGGEITGNTAKNGGGVYTNGSTAFTVKGGTIGGSTAADANAAKYGGGVYVKNGAFTMSGGKVTGNGASKDGGGVRLDKGTFNMSGSAVISRNTADGYGGGVDANDGSFTMSGGSITGNTTTNESPNWSGGGGVCVFDDGSFTMSGGSITGNNSLRGAGVELVGSGTMTVSGSVQITGNWQNGELDSANGLYVQGSRGKANNLYLFTGKTVAIGTDGLNAGARIGVTTEDWPDPGSPVKIATNAANEESHYTAIFTPDAEEADYKITQENDTVYLSAHEHTWRYALKSGTKDTISATCEECSWNGGSVTIKAPEHTVYGDGKDQSVQIENTNWLPEYPANAVSYRKGEETIEAPTDAGSYTGVLTIGGVEATVDYTIGRKTVSAGDVTFSHTRTTYDGTQKNVADFLVVIVDGKTLTPGTDYVVFGTTSASDFEEEGYNARIALQGNYEGTVPFRWHIDPREAELELVNAADRRYGDGKGAVTLRVTNAVGNDRVSVTVTGGDDLSVGTHSVTATALDCPEYTLPADAAKRTLTYSVGKGKINRVNLTMDVYNNVAKKHTYDFAQALPALADGLTYGTCTYTGENNMNASVVSGIGFNGSVLTFNTGRIISKEGTSILWYTATVKSDNYEDIKLSLDVQTKDKTVADLPESDITMEGWSYGQTPNRPSVANLPAGVTPTFTYKDANGAEFTPAKTTDAGVYSVTVRYETEDTVYTGTRSFTVAPKTLTAEDIGEYGPSGIIPNKTYDSGTGIDLTGLGVKKAALVGTDENLIISGSAEFASANAGDTTLVFTTNGKLSKAPGTAVKASNYTIAEGLTKEFAAKINPRWLDFTVDSVSKRFGSPDSTADVRVTFTGVAGNSQSGLVSGETLEQGVDYDVRATFSQTAVGQDDGVVVTVTLKDTAKAKNYKLVSGSVATSGEIKKAAAPVISEQTVLVYSNAEKDYVVGLHVRWPSGTPAFSEYDTPLVEDTDLTEATAILRESFGGFKPSATAGDVAIDVHLKPFIAPVGTDLGIIKFVMKSANCEDAVVPVRFKVMAKTQRALSVSIENWTYGSTPSQPVYGAPGGTASGPDITYTSRDGQTSYGATAPTDAGDYTVTIRCESIDTIWSGSADFTISRKQITQPAADTTAFTYTADEQTYTLAASPDYTISDNTVQTNVGDYTIRVSLNDTANTEWTDGTTEEKAYTFTIDPAALTVTALDKEILVGQSAPDLSDPAEGTDYSVEGLLGADVLTGVTLTYGETPDTGRMGSYAIHAAAALANYDVACVSGTLTIRKAAAPVLADIPFSCKYTLTGEQTVDVSGLVPGAEGYTLGAAAGETAIVSGAAVDANGVVTYTLTGAGKAGDSVTLPVTISSAKYENAVVNVVITMLPRDEQAALRVTGGTTVVYGETLQLGTSGGSGTGAVTYAVTEINGKATIDANGLLTPVQVGSVTVTATKAGDDAYNDVTSAAVEITIRKAKPTGVPSYTPVTGRGKTLRDAALTIEGGSLSLKDGTLEWVDKDGNVLPDDTVIEAGKSYKWRFTPADGNYTAISGEIVLYSPAEDDTGHGNSHNYRTIMVTVRGNGSVSPSGWANVPIGGDQTFTITPDKGYAVAKVLIDGQSVGAVTSYTFQSVTEGHTIEVIFMKANGNPQTGVTVGQRTVG